MPHSHQKRWLWAQTQILHSVMASHCEIYYNNEIIQLNVEMNCFLHCWGGNDEAGSHGAKVENKMHKIYLKTTDSINSMDGD